MTDNHEEMRGLVAADVLGAVTPDEAAAVEEHLTTCAECRQLERELREVEALLPALAGEMAPAADVKGRVMAAVLAEPREDPRASAAATHELDRLGVRAAPGTASATPAPLVLPRRSDRRRQILSLAAIAAVLVLAIVGVAAWRLLNPAQPQPTRTYAMSGTLAMPSISGRLDYYRRNEEIDLSLKGLKQIPAHSVYELWLVHLHGTRITGADGVVAFRPAADGTIYFKLSNQNVPAYNLAGLTIERAIAATPTLPIVAKAGLS